MSDSISGEINILKNRLTSNSTKIAGSKICLLLVNLLLIKVAVNKIGIAKFGVWEVIYSSGSTLNLLVPAIASTLLYQCSKEYESKNYVGIQKAYSHGLFYLTVQLIVSILLTVILIICSGCFGVVSTNDSQCDAPGYMFLLCVLLMLSLNGVNQLLAGILNGCHVSGEVAIVQLSSEVVGVVVKITLLLLDFGLVSFIYGCTVSYIVCLFLSISKCNKIIGRLVHFPTLPSKADIAILKTYLFPLLLGSLAVISREHITKIILVNVANAEWVGWYSVASKIANVLLLVFSFFVAPAIAIFGSLSNIGDSHKNECLFSYMSKILNVSIGSMGVFIVVASSDILNLFLGYYDPIVSVMLQMLSIAYCIAAIFSGVPSSYCRGIGAPIVETFYALVNLAIYIGLVITCVIIAWPMGIIGSYLASWSICSIGFALVVIRKFNLTRRVLVNSFLSCLSVIAVSAIILATYKYVSLLNNLPNVVNICLKGIFGFVAYLTILRLTMVINKGDLHISRIRSILKPSCY